MKDLGKCNTMGNPRDNGGEKAILAGTGITQRAEIITFI